MEVSWYLIVDMSVLGVLIPQASVPLPQNVKGIDVCRQVQLLISQATSHENLQRFSSDGEWAVPLCAYQEVWEWSCTQTCAQLPFHWGV